MHLILAGATGLVGRHVLDLALADARVQRVTAPVRRPLAHTHARLHAPVVTFDSLPRDADWWQADAFICALGTTRKAAGSRAVFAQVDLAYPLAMARHAHAAGTPCCVVTTAMGANPRSAWFYNRTKGLLEDELRAQGFDSLTLVRPGLIGGHRQAHRPMEALAARVLTTLHPLLPPRLRINPAERIASALLDAAISARAGVHVVGAAALN